MILVEIARGPITKQFLDQTGLIFVPGAARAKDKCNICHTLLADHDNCYIHNPDDEFTACEQCVEIVSIEKIVKYYAEHTKETITNGRSN